MMNEPLNVLFSKACTLQQEGQLPQAISLFEQILFINPQHQESLHFLGLAYAQLGDMDKAIHHLLQARAIKPDATLANNLGNAYKLAGKNSEAKHYYLEAIELNAQYAQAHNNLGAIYALENNYQQAIAHYAKAVNAEPDFTTAHYNLGLLLLKNNQLTAAKTQFNNVLALNPDASDAQFYLGILALSAGSLAEAESAFLNVVQANSGHVEAITNLGVIALKKDQGQLAVDYFTRALTLDIDHVDARNNLAATFMHYDRFENALMHYDVLLKTEPNQVEYLYNSGVAEMALGHLNEATLFFDRALEVQPDHAHSLNNLAAIYLKLDMRSTSREYLERALAINSQDTISRHMLHAILEEDKANTTPEYAQNLFNNYALYYDQHMRGTLQYSLPQHLGRIIHQLRLTSVENALDLGCGTGLTGVVIREISHKLTGVDIAEKMLTYAKETGLYDLIVNAEITRFLRENNQLYDLIVAADVLPYFGDLGELFRLISEHLMAGGYFIFSTEINETKPWKLETSARFSHQPEYIHTLAAEHLAKVVQQERVPARLQNQLPLEVMIYVLQKG